jgi:tetratricopeptide (TPR) repeat protein
MSWGEAGVWVSVLLHLALLGYAIKTLRNRSLPGLVVWVYFAGISLYSNVLFSIGTFMNERFLYVPTLGISVLAAAALISLGKKQKHFAAALGILAIGLMAFKTTDRNLDWEDDAILAITDVAVSENSAKCNMSAGGGYYDRAMTQRTDALRNKDLALSVKHLNRSLEIYPTFMPALLLSGNSYTALKEYDKGIYFYERCLQRNAGHSHSIANLEYVAQEASKEKKFEFVAQAFGVLSKYQPHKALYHERLGETLGRDLGKPQESLPHLQKALEVGGDGAELRLKLGVANAMLNQLQAAKTHFRAGIEIAPQHGRLWFNLGILYQNTGNPDSADYCLRQAFAFEPELKGGN